ncbi:MAG: glycosyltransferase family 4 protein [Oscillospiraceae bacterium]|nr:glycosyltransferase family 4 protein [Oscillospiraceae bacterium]
MKKVLFLTNFASPYRVHFFDELGKYVDVTVLYSDRVEDITHRDKSWFEEGEGGFHPVQLTKTAGVKDENLCMDVLPWLKKKWDAIVIGGYSSPTAILAMLWLRLHRIPFYMEVDGGLVRQERRIKYLVKRTLVRLAPRWLSTGRFTTKYLVHYGAEEEKVTNYPFSSLYENNILPGIVSREEKLLLRQELDIPEKHMLLAIGQFIHRKGFDVLLRSAVELDKNVGIYIVGGEATEEYRSMKERLGLTNVHFLGFQKKDTLEKFYKAADLFVLPTREDIWGLVINEAMAYGLPVITTDRCVAGLELVEDGVNGYIVPVEAEADLAEKIRMVLASDMEAMGKASLEKIRPYTLENMAKVHAEIFESGR